MAYFTFEKDKENFCKRSSRKIFFKRSTYKKLMKQTDAEIGDSIFFACNKKKN